MIVRGRSSVQLFRVILLLITVQFLAPIISAEAASSHEELSIHQTKSGSFFQNFVLEKTENEELIEVGEKCAEHFLLLKVKKAHHNYLICINHAILHLIDFHSSIDQVADTPLYLRNSILII